MNLPTTLAFTSIALILTAFFGWRGAQPSRPGRIRLAPWRLMMLLAFTGLIAMAVHLVTLTREKASHESEPNAFIQR